MTIRRLLLLLAIMSPASLAAQATDPAIELARRVLRATPLIDGHNDLPWAIRNDPTARGNVAAYDLRRTTPGHTDIARLRQGMVGGQFWSVYVPGEYADSGFARVQLEEIDIARRVIERYPDVLELALTAADVRRSFAAGKIGSLLGMEGGHALENSLGALRSYYDLGARYLTLTHNVTLDWADAAAGPATHGGLTDFGRDVVREMNRLGMLVDLSHTSPGTMSDALDVAQAPVIFSHSNARALAEHVRNVPDSILRRLPANGGVVMVTFVPGFLSQPLIDHNRTLTTTRQAAAARFGADTVSARRAVNTWQADHPPPRATLAQVADHIHYIRTVAGVDHVGIGGDFDGITEVVLGLEDVSTYPALFAELARRGWTEGELKKLAGENILRALEGAEATARRLRR
ncbi:MAG: dipeptidase [Gemmatimonadota bacterium]|nr:dipeptidase [Gemmatimonadota bacterium]